MFPPDCLTASGAYFVWIESTTRHGTRKSLEMAHLEIFSRDAFLDLKKRLVDLIIDKNSNGRLPPAIAAKQGRIPDPYSISNSVAAVRTFARDYLSKL